MIKRILDTLFNLSVAEVLFILALLFASAVLWHGRAAQTSTPTTAPKIIEAYFKDVKDVDPEWVALNIKFSTRLLVVFKTDVPIQAGYAYIINVNYIDTSRVNIGCGGSWGTAPISIDGWYAVDCTNITRTSLVTDVTISLISGKFDAKRIPAVENVP